MTSRMLLQHHARRPNECVLPEQVDAYYAREPFTACSYPGVSSGLCVDEVCTAVRCGDGILVPGEVCDDGNVVGDDGCATDCQSLEVCGDAIASPGRSGPDAGPWRCG